MSFSVLKRQALTELSISSNSSKVDNHHTLPHKSFQVTY